MAITGNLTREIQKGHVALMRHEETGFYAGVFLLGESSVVQDVPTACTDGRNKYYGENFMRGLESTAQLRALIMHENLHVALKHIHRHQDLIKADPQLAGAAMDYVVNDVIMCLNDKKLCVLPEDRLWHAKFHNWSVREVYNFLKNGQDKSKSNPGGSGQKPKRDATSVTVAGEKFALGAMDEHRTVNLGDLTPEQVRELDAKIDEAIQQGAMLAGIKGLNVPRAVRDAITPDVDWRQETMDFVTSQIKGHDEYTWRRFARRGLADDYYFPSTYSEKITEMVFAGDMSGSIGGAILAQIIGAIVNACTACNPDKVRILWWDTEVCSEQIFETGQYEDMLQMLKPRGGGGTHVGSVAKYMADKNIVPDCLIVLTDGYTEDPIQWDIETPTLWLVTENENFQPPKGQKVKVNA